MPTASRSAASAPRRSTCRSLALSGAPGPNPSTICLLDGSTTPLSDGAARAALSVTLRVRTALQRPRCRDHQGRLRTARRSRRIVGVRPSLSDREMSRPHGPEPMRSLSATTPRVLASQSSASLTAAREIVDSGAIRSKPWGVPAEDAKFRVRTGRDRSRTHVQDQNEHRIRCSRGPDPIMSFLSDECITSNPQRRHRRSRAAAPALRSVHGVHEPVRAGPMARHLHA